MKGKRVLLALSGGVDSSVAAHILRLQGYEVIAATLRLHETAIATSAIEDSVSVARQLGIEHHVVDESQAFEKLVQQPFITEYRNGRTPSPCILCNRFIKFDRLMELCEKLDCDFLATGHYAITDPQIPALYRARDHHKDQSYFLFLLTPEILSRTLMPLGAMSKLDIRTIAKEIGLTVADKPDSQEICFVPDNDYISFIRTYCGSLHPGNFVDSQGRVLGQHDGIERFTVGQRRGLPGGNIEPYFVIDIDAARGQVMIGPRSMLERWEFFVEGLNWIAGEPCETRGTIKIRNTASPAGCLLTPLGDGRAHVLLERPQYAITPSQAAVLYKGEHLIAGGWIAKNPTT